jgi:hypothetical protein
MRAGREPKQWMSYSSSSSSSAPTKSSAQTPMARKEKLVKQLLSACGNPALQVELMLELHNSLMGAERLIANLQGGKHMAQRSRDESRASMVNENMDLLKVCGVLERGEDGVDQIPSLRHGP